MDERRSNKSLAASNESETITDTPKMLQYMMSDSVKNTVAHYYNQLSVLTVALKEFEYILSCFAHS